MFHRRQPQPGLSGTRVLQFKHFSEIIHIFRQFEEWKFNGANFDILEIGVSLSGYSSTPESFYVSKYFCQ